MHDFAAAVRQRIADRVMHEPLGFVRLFRALPGDTYVRSVLDPEQTIILTKEPDSFWKGGGYNAAFGDGADSMVMTMLVSLADKAEPGNIGGLFRYALVVADDFGDVLPEVVSFLVKHDVEVLLYSYLSYAPDSMAFRHGRYLENMPREMEYVQGRGIVYGDYMPEYPGFGKAPVLLPLPPCSECGTIDPTAEYQMHYSGDGCVVEGVVLCSSCHIGPSGIHRNTV